MRTAPAAAAYQFGQANGRYARSRPSTAIIPLGPVAKILALVLTSASTRPSAGETAVTRAGLAVTMITAYGVSAADVPEPAGRLHAVRPVAIEKPRSVVRSALRITANPSLTASTSSPLAPCQSTRPSC